MICPGGLDRCYKTLVFQVILHFVLDTFSLFQLPMIGL